MLSITKVAVFPNPDFFSDSQIPVVPTTRLDHGIVDVCADGVTVMVLASNYLSYVL